MTDKRMITATFAVTASNEFLPMQLIYTGKTYRSLPKDVTFPVGFHVTYNKNRWDNVQTTIGLIQDIIVPYICRISYLAR